MRRNSFFFKFTAITLLFVFVSVQSTLHEVLKLPELISHYQEHKTENQSISFVKFLEEHYLNSLQNHDSKHQRLPFKDEAHSLMIGIQFVASSNVILSQSEHHRFLPYLGLKDHVPCKKLCGGIWQPPKYNA